MVLTRASFTDSTPAPAPEPQPEPMPDPAPEPFPDDPQRPDREPRPGDDEVSLFELRVTADAEVIHPDGTKD